MLTAAAAPLAPVAATATATTAPKTKRLTVFAASLTDARDRTSDAWQAQGRAGPAFPFASSGVLARQIDAGALADLLRSANETWMGIYAMQALTALALWDRLKDRLAPAENVRAIPGSGAARRSRTSPCRSRPSNCSTCWSGTTQAIFHDLGFTSLPAPSGRLT